MDALLWTVSILSGTLALTALAVSLLVARRYREMYAVVMRPGEPGAELPRAGAPVPDQIVTTIEDDILELGDPEGEDRLVAFLLTDCPACVTLVPELRKAFADLPAGAPRPVAVVSGDQDKRAEYVTTFGPVAHVVESDAIHPLATELGVTGFPTVLVIREGTVRQASHSLTGIDVAAPGGVR